MTVRAFAPGRVNLIGDHTDYTGGFCLPMAIDLGTTVMGESRGERVVLRSDAADGLADVALDLDDPSEVQPVWARVVAAVVAELRPEAGFTGSVTTTLPIGAGLSSSAALEVAVALALGFDGPTGELARLCQRAEHRASGVPCGIMDQLSSAAGVDGHALLLDCRAESVQPVPVPPDARFVLVPSGETRTLAGTGYAERRRQCEAAEAAIGPLRDATERDLDRIDDTVLRRRARHVVRENQRVLDVVACLGAGDLAGIGALMTESHRSLAEDFEVSTPALDGLIDRLLVTPGVLGARLTGAGFGGAVVALTEPGAFVDGWWVRPSGGATRS